MLVTIFTPTYNRAYILPKLFASLKRQYSKDFEWVIVDDGSSDDTEKLVKNFQLEVAQSRFQEQPILFDIRYFKQRNGGKHLAVNKGLKEAKGELFFIVDSDDYLADDAIAWIEIEYEKIKNDIRFAGLSGIRVTPNGDKIGGGSYFDTIDTNALEIRRKHHVQGDLAEIIKTEIFRKFFFPVFQGETFCPEALVWNRIAQHYILRYVHKGIYVCDYLPDGLTARIVKLRHRSPMASLLFYSELFSFETSIILKLRAAINYWRFNNWKLLPNAKNLQMVNSISLIALPLGVFANVMDRIKGQL